MDLADGTRGCAQCQARGRTCLTSSVSPTNKDRCTPEPSPTEAPLIAGYPLSIAGQTLPTAIPDTPKLNVSVPAAVADDCIDALRVIGSLDDAVDTACVGYSSDMDGESLCNGQLSPLPCLRQPSDFNRLYHQLDDHEARHSSALTVSSSSPTLLHCLLPPQDEQRPISTFSLYSPVHSADDFLSDPTTPVPTSLPFPLSDSVMECLATYFALLNRGLYFFFDETAFYQQLNDTVNDWSTPNLSSSPPCEGWLMGLCAAVAIGARMQGDCELADRAALRATEAVRCFHHLEEAGGTSSWGCSSCIDTPLASRVSAYRSCLALCYYTAVMDDTEQCSHLLAIADHLIQAPDVKDCIPAAVRMLADLMPNVSAAIADLCDTSLSDTTTHSPSTSTTTPSSSAPCDQSHGRSPHVSELLRQQAELFPLDRWKYYAVKRALRPQLFDLADDDPELTLGAHLDSSLHVEVECSTSSLRAELAAINYHLTLIACRPASEGAAVACSLWNFLALLLKAEATADTTQLSAHQRVGVLGRQAVCHSMLGNTVQALRAARAAVRLLSQLHSANPCSVRLPPFALSFTRCVALVGQLDDSDDGHVVLGGGLAVIEALARLWPSMARVLKGLQHELLLLVTRQLSSLNVQLQENRRRLQNVDVDVKGGDESQYVELSDAASQVVQLSSRIRRLRRKRAVLCERDSRLAVELRVSLTAPPSSPSASIASTSMASSSGSGSSWTVDSVTDSFSASLSLEQNPLRTQGISRGLYEYPSISS